MLASMLSIRSCSFRAAQHWISDVTVQCSCFSFSKSIIYKQIHGTKLLRSISPTHFQTGCALFETRSVLSAKVSTVTFFSIFNIKTYSVMGESFFCRSFFETLSEKRATYFEPVLSHEVYLERLLCEQVPGKMRCRYDESLFGQDSIFGRPVGF